MTRASTNRASIEPHRRADRFACMALMMAGLDDCIEGRLVEGGSLLVVGWLVGGRKACVEVGG